MIRVNRALVALLLAMFVAVPAFAQQPQQAPAVEKPKFIIPIRGTAEIEYTLATALKGNEVVSTLKIKNVSKEPIAGLKVDEIWWAKDRSLVPGGASFRNKKPLMPGEIVTVELRTVKDKAMAQNQFQFSHAYGGIKFKKVTKLE